ncbi:copper chaperone PCu(A)C [Azospirillum sp. A39]|uniref:copper chaperone PCu(A)C n=1 Tax=Azospirillum sp. A39 TaxID=3462279 RepID=UPI0040464F95
MKTVFAAALAAALAAGPVLAADAPAGSAGTIAVVAPWARATAPHAKVGGAYMTLTNSGSTADRLLSAASPAAEKVELHTHLMDQGVMRMRPVEDIAVEPGTPTVLQPGGLHVMLMGLKQPLTEGSRFPLTLTFETAGAVTVEVPVQAAGAMEHKMEHKTH